MAIFSISGRVRRSGTSYFVGGATQTGLSPTTLRGPLPTEWIVGGATAYVQRVFLKSNGDVGLQLSTSSSGSGVSAGPEFTDAVKQKIIITFSKSGGDNQDFLFLNGIGDSTEPYVWTPSNSGAVATFTGLLRTGDVWRVSLDFGTLPPVAASVVYTGIVRRAGSRWQLVTSSSDRSPTGPVVPPTWVLEGGPSYLRGFWIRNTGEITMRFDSSVSGTGVTLGPDFVHTVEAGIRLIMESGGHSVQTDGITDLQEPYDWVPSNSADFIAFYNELSVNDPWTLTLRYPATPPQALTPNLVTQLASAFNPTLAQPVLDQVLTPNLVSQLTQVFDPSLKTAIKLTLPLVAQIAQERTHVVSGSVYQDGNFYYIGQAGNNVVPQSGALPTEWMVGGATGYLTIAAVTSGGQVLLRTDVVKTYGGIQPGPEFLPAVETGIRLTFEGGGSSVEVTGITDTTEPYLWTPSNSSAVAAFYGGLSVGASVSLSLRYPPAGTGLVEVFSPALEVLEPLVTLSPSLVTRLATAHDPALSVAQGLTLTLVTSLATTFDPVTSLNLSPSLVTQRVRTFDPTLKATAGLTPNRVSQLVRVFDPTLRATAELAPSLVKQLVTGFDPTIETVTGLAPSLVEQPVTVFDPALSTGPVELTLPAVLRLVVVADPALRHSLALNLVTQFAASFDPTFTQLTSTQEGYRWRNDDGTESTATWLADQDADVSVAELVTVRLRGIVDWEDDPEPGQIGIEYRRTGVGDWRAV